MKKTLERLLCISLILVLALTMAGCNAHASMSYTYTLDTGDSIKVSLNVLDGYSISSDIPFTVSCEDQALTQGLFYQGYVFSEYLSVVQSDPNAELLERGEKDGNSYIFWSYNSEYGMEYNYAVYATDADVTVLLGNNVSLESAVECFNRLTISLAE